MLYTPPLNPLIIRFSATLVELDGHRSASYQSDFIEAAYIEQLEEHAIDLALHMNASAHSQLHIVPVSQNIPPRNWYSIFLGTDPRHFCHERQQAILDCKHPLRIWYTTKQRIVDLSTPIRHLRAQKIAGSYRE